MKDLRENNREQFSNLHRAMIQETTRVVTAELQSLGSHIRETVTRKVNRVILDINETLKATNVALSKSVATEVVTRLEPLVEKHNQLNDKLMSMSSANGSGMADENPTEIPPLGYPRPNSMAEPMVRPPFQTVSRSLPPLDTNGGDRSQGREVGSSSGCESGCNLNGPVPSSSALPPTNPHLLSSSTCLIPHVGIPYVPHAGTSSGYGNFSHGAGALPYVADYPQSATNAQAPPNL